MENKQTTPGLCCTLSIEKTDRIETPPERVNHLVALGQALADPIRVRMLGLMAEGRDCCSFPDLGAPLDEEENGICVCEFMSFYNLKQSKVSYHLSKLKKAGLIREEKRGKWNFYSVDRQAVQKILEELNNQLGG